MLKCTHNGHLYTCTPCYKLYCIHLFLWVYVRTTNCNNKSCNWNCYLLIYLFIMWSFKLFHPSSHTRKNIYTYWTFFKLNAAIGIKYENFIFKQRINGAIRQMNWKNGNKVATDKCKIDFVVFIRFFFVFSLYFGFLFFTITRAHAIKRTVILIGSKVLEPTCPARYDARHEYLFCFLFTTIAYNICNCPAGQRNKLNSTSWKPQAIE